MGVFEGTTAVGGWQGRGGWVDRREVGEITGFLPTPSFVCLFLCASFIKEGQRGSLKASQQEVCDCTVWYSYTCKDVYENSNELMSPGECISYKGTYGPINVCAYVCACVMREQPAVVRLTPSSGKAELGLLEGWETDSSSLHTSLFKGAIKVWQKCQCCRQGTGLWMSVLLRSTLRFSLPCTGRRVGGRWR